MVAIAVDDLARRLEEQVGAELLFGAKVEVVDVAQHFAADGLGKVAHRLPPRQFAADLGPQEGDEGRDVLLKQLVVGPGITGRRPLHLGFEVVGQGSVRTIVSGGGCVRRRTAGQRLRVGNRSENGRNPARNIAALHAGAWR